jgi:hypothetical protein
VRGCDLHKRLKILAFKHSSPSSTIILSKQNCTPAEKQLVFASAHTSNCSALFISIRTHVFILPKDPSRQLLQEWNVWPPSRSGATEGHTQAHILHTEITLKRNSVLWEGMYKFVKNSRTTFSSSYYFLIYTAFLHSWVLTNE